MAINNEVISTKLKLVFSEGLNENGKEKISMSIFSKINEKISDEDLHKVGSLIDNLTKKDCKSIIKLVEVKLVEN